MLFNFLRYLVIFFFFIIDIFLINNNISNIYIKYFNYIVYKKSILCIKSKKYNNYNLIHLHNSIFLCKKVHFFKLHDENKKKFLTLNYKKKIFIKKIIFSGNSFLSDIKLKKIIQFFHIDSGMTFNFKDLNKFLLYLHYLYQRNNFLNTFFDITLDLNNKNNLIIKIKVIENINLNIFNIKIYGNKNFYITKLLKVIFYDNITSLWDIFLSKKYNEYNFKKYIHKLISFYKKNGYMDCKVLFIKKVLSKDKKKIFFKIFIHEGTHYSFYTKYNIYNNFLNTKKQYKLKNMFYNKNFKIFDFNFCKQKIRYFFLQLGCLNVQVLHHLEFDYIKKRVLIHLLIIPNKQYFVKNMYFLGINIDKNSFIRNTLISKKCYFFNKDLIRKNCLFLMKSKLFLKVSVHAYTNKSKPNFIHLIYIIKPKDNNNTSLSANYDMQEGFLLRFLFLRKNFFGKGNGINIKILKNILFTHAELWLLQPYSFIKDFSARSHFFFHSFRKNHKNKDDYITKKFGFNFSFFTPHINKKKFLLSLGYINHSIIHLSSQISLLHYFSSFKNKFPTEEKIHFISLDDFFIKYIFDYNNFNKFHPPSSGNHIKILGKFMLPFSDNFYHKLIISSEQYLPINKTKNFLLHICSKTGLGFSLGNHVFPFYENFFLGGLHSIRGFKDNTISPRAAYQHLEDSKNTSNKKTNIGSISPSYHFIGGNLITNTNVEFLFAHVPHYKTVFQHVQLGTFLDVGSILDSKWENFVSIFKNSNFSDPNVLYISTGFFMRCASFIGPVTFTLSLPIINNHISKNYFNLISIDFNK